jgi:hypothetical protein
MPEPLFRHSGTAHDDNARNDELIKKQVEKEIKEKVDEIKS